MSYKVFQWASGNVGRHTGRVICERADLELVGLHVTNPDKVGRDAAELLGLNTQAGVSASSDIEVVLNSSADVVVHTPLPSMVYGDNPDQDVDDFCQLLAAGKNVITVVGYMYPKVYGPALMDRLQSACIQGGSSFHSTGLNPGWLGDLIPLTMSGLCASVQHVKVLEISTFEHYPSPEIMFGSMGFNTLPDQFEQSNARRGQWLTGLFSESVQMVADGINLGVTQITSEQNLALADADLSTAAGTVRAGTVAGQHWRWAGLDASGEERIVHETVWRMHHTVAPGWPEGKNSVSFTGSPSMHLEFEPDFSWMSDSLLATGMHAINAIPYVVDAQPGVQTFLDLPWIMCRQS